jgi:hypothetical protein
MMKLVQLLNSKNQDLPGYDRFFMRVASVFTLSVLRRIGLLLSV